MAVQTLSSRQSFPSMAGYHQGVIFAPSSSPMQPSPHDNYFRSSYYASNYNLPNQGMYSYPSYSAYTFAPPAASYHPAPMASSYGAVSNQSNGVMMPQQTNHHTYDHSQPPAPPAVATQVLTPVSSAGSPTHSKVDYMETHRNVLPSVTEHHHQKRRASHDGSKSEGSANTLPGPIPATTPLVVRHDQNGVQWILFEYSRDRIKHEYTIRCDVESVNLDELAVEFKMQNCVYPRAMVRQADYKGNRIKYETECNAVGWALSKLNHEIRGKRGLIQRAVDSWRNSNSDPKYRSRRVRRQNKIASRQADRQQSVQPSQQAMLHMPPAPQSSIDAYRPHGAMTPTSQTSYSYMHAPSMVPGHGGLGGIQYSL